MRDTRNTQDVMLNLLREELNDPSLSLESALEHPVAKMLLESANRAFGEQKPTERAVEARPGDLSVFPDSPAVIKAAIHDSFDLGELAATKEERDVLLAASDIVTIDGERRLRLKDDSRAAILAAKRDPKLYSSILDQAMRENEPHEAIARDPIRCPSAWLQRFLARATPSISKTHHPMISRPRSRPANDCASSKGYGPPCPPWPTCCGAWNWPICSSRCACWSALKAVGTANRAATGSSAA